MSILPTLARWARRTYQRSRCGFSVEYSRLAAWRPPLQDGWQGPGAARRFQAGLEGAYYLEGVNLASFDHSLIARDQLEILARVGMHEAALLDLGCGNGVYRNILAAYPATSHWSYAGADVNEALVAACRRWHSGVRFETVTDGGRLPFLDGEFDVILASGVLQYAEDPSATMAELHRVTHGWVLVSRVPVRKHADSGIYLQRVWHRWGREEHPTHVFNRGKLEAMFTGAGFEIAWRDHGVECFPLPGEEEPAIHVLYLLRWNVLHEVAGGTAASIKLGRRAR